MRVDINVKPSLCCTVSLLDKGRKKTVSFRIFRVFLWTFMVFFSVIPCRELKEQLSINRKRTVTLLALRVVFDPAPNS